MKVSVERIGIPVEKMKIELVERKGVGHPDTLADGIAEQISRELSRYYLKSFGRVLHHNTDKLQISAGRSYPVFGGGDILKPITFVLGGRATTEIEGEIIPVNDIAENATANYLRDVLPHLDIKKGVKIINLIGKGSADLVDVFEREGMPKANDTSLGVGYAPLSATEEAVLETEGYLNSERCKKKHPGVGEDIKVMGLRIEKKLLLTVAMATVSSEIDSIEEYVELKNSVSEEIREIVCEKFKDVEIKINSADDVQREVVFLTVTGTSAEMGDDGAVGRGNRANGIITPNRPMSMEACAGKNPINHVGKLYTLLAFDIAKEIVDLGAKTCYVRALSSIGAPINKPKVVNIEIEGDVPEGKIEKVVEEKFEGIRELSRKIIDGKVTLF